MKKFVLWSVLILLLLPVLFGIVLSTMPDRYLTVQTENVGSWFTGGDLTIESATLQLWRRHPAINVKGIQLLSPTSDRLLSIDTLHLAIDMPQLLTLALSFPEVHITAPSIYIERHADGSMNWDSLPLIADKKRRDELPSSGVEKTQQRREPISLPQISELLLTDAAVSYLDQQQDVTVNLTGEIISRLPAESPTTIAVAGSINRIPVRLDATLPSLTSLQYALSDTQVLENVTAKIAFADSVATAEGDVAVHKTAVTDLMVSVNLAGTKNLQQMLGISLPELPPLQLQGQLTTDGKDYVFRRFNGRLVRSHLQGDIRLNPATSPVTLYANVIATRLDIDDLAGLIGGTPDDSRQSHSTQHTHTADLLPSEPIDLIPLTKLFNGAVEFRADSIISGRWPLQSLDARFEIEGTDVAIPRIEIAIADGRVNGAMKLNAATQPPEIVTKLNVRQVDLKTVMQSLGVDDESFGILGGEVKLWSKGNSIAEFAANLDGGMFLLMVNGKLNALLAELAGIDVLESLALIIEPGESITEIRCAYLDVLVEQGTVDVGTMVLDTVDTLFIADGKIDLASEQLNLIVEPHPKDVSIVASKTSAVISGTLSNPSVTPGSALTARTVVAASLAALASPLTALLPFVQLSTEGNSHYCTGLIESIDAQR
jgi:uncharacterized protein involved in outer membrane biogenesis